MITEGQITMYLIFAIVFLLFVIASCSCSKEGFANGANIKKLRNACNGKTDGENCKIGSKTGKCGTRSGKLLCNIYK